MRLLTMDGAVMPASDTQGLLHLLRAGGAPLMIFGLLGRLPTAMAPMLLLVAIPVGGGSLVQAGSAVGLSALGTAASGAAVGLLVDRLGARPVVGAIAAVQSAALLGLAAQFGNLNDSPLLLPLAFVVGLCNPSIGSLARAAWIRRVETGELDGPGSRSAMAWEAASDEAGFVIAPVIASSLLVAIEPRAALVGLAGVGLVVHLGFVRLVPLRVVTIGGSRRGIGGEGLEPVFPAHAGQRPVLLALAAILIAISVGLVFGATQATVNSLFAVLGVPAMVGVIYGLVGIGSIAGGVVWAQTPDRLRGTWIIVAAGAALVALGALAIGWPSMGIVATGVLCAFVGLWLSPVLAEAYGRARRVVSNRFQVTMMTVLASGTSVGVGVSAPLASNLSVTYGAQRGFLVLIVAGAGFLIGGGYILLRQASYRRHDQDAHDGTDARSGQD
ncbi:hypothetical protein DS079_00705 [Brachybacterium paraconglomeratum]|uniref:MFS transporter n=2 Tax=Brachybacterium TaxID=43668 RepID=A0A426SPB5_9MICO|nr:hypothetical protein DS079_00705 [Brachybacterium paraconglomeratum]